MTLECVKHVLAFPAVLIETLISLGYQDFTLPITARIMRFQVRVLTLQRARKANFSELRSNLCPAS